MNCLTLIQAGHVAHDALARGGGEICAAFRRSVYLRLADERYVCLGDATLGRGPINGIVRETHALASLAPGDRVEIQADDVSVWFPETRIAKISVEALARNLRALEQAAAHRVVREGLGPMLIGESSPLLRHARPALHALDEWLDSAAAVPPAVLDLLGLGPGLTPSGDDYLAGVLVALHAIGRNESAGRLWDGLRGAATSRTHAISRAHLLVAAEGEAHEALHRCVGTLFDDAEAAWDKPLADLADLAVAGHCSGWDGLAGTAAVARSALRVRLN